MTNRRHFLYSLALASTAPLVLTVQSTPMRAAIIGHTGRGNYGHGLDVAFTGVPGIEVVAVADPDEKGRNTAMQKSGAAKGYADWRDLLEAERPEVVCLASRWSEYRHEIGMAALTVGAHLFTEKPFTPTLAQADDLLTLAEAENRKIAVAHQIRLAPGILRLKEAIENGLIGELVQIQSWGKQDSRAGGEDMIVLGSHLFDLIRFFAGSPLFCTARVLENGKEITRSSGRPIKEQIGLVAGNEIFAQFGFPNGLNATFTSTAKLRDTLGPWSIRLIGSKGSVHILVEIDPAIYLLADESWGSKGRIDAWDRWPDDPARNFSDSQRGFGPANRRLVDDFLDAIRTDRPPVCSGKAATDSLEMIMAVYEAAISQQRVPFPMKKRAHPLRS